MNRRNVLLVLTASIVLIGLWVILPQNGTFSGSSNAINGNEEESQQDNPGLAAAQNFEMIKDPALGYPPTQRKVQAYERLLEIQRNKPVVESAIPGVEWTERGSDNVGGRTRALMFDPNDPTAKKLWAGAIGGGLWYLDDVTDNAATWKNVAGIMDNLAVSTLAYDPTTPTTFYLGTGLGFTNDIRGEGIWKSVNGGLDWTQISSTADNSNFHYVQRIQVTAQGTVLAATRDGIMRSTDGGDSWTNVRGGRMADIEVASDGTVYASQGVNSAGDLWKSTNDGSSWTSINPAANGRRTEIALSASNPSVIYAIAAGGSGSRDIEWFRKSVDKGETWTNLTIPMYMNQSCTESDSYFTRGQAWFDLSLGVHPENPNIVIAGGIDLHKSEDGGQTWYPISYWTGNACDEFAHADQHFMTWRPGFPNEAVFGNDGGVDYSRDVGSSANPDFDRRVRGYNTMLFYAMAMANEPGSNVMLAGAQDNGTQRFADPGLNSTRMVAGGDGAFCFIDQNNPDIQISSFVFNVFRVSTNGGKSFTNVSNDQQSGRFINPADYDDAQGMLFSAGDDSQLKRIKGIKTTPESQETISLGIGGGQISTIKISPNQPKRLFLGTGSGQIFRIDSTHLTNMVSTPISNSIEGSTGYTSSIDVGETDDHLLITYSNYGVNSIYETRDGGDTWQNKEGDLPDIPVRWGLFNPENTNEVLIATELGVWSTTEFDSDMPVWEPTNSGLASVRTDMLKYRSADKLVGAATHGRGVFTSSIFANTSVADFVADRKVGYAGKPVSFVDASQASSNSFAWDFGDGNTSTDQNPSHTYANPGTYTVSLSVASGADTETKENFVTILDNKAIPYSPADGGDFESNATDFASASLLHDINLWERGTPTGTLNTPSSGSNAWKTGLSSTIGNLGYDHMSALYTPSFDLSVTDKDLTLKFNLSAESASCGSPVGLYMEYSLDNGLNWQILGSSRRSVGDTNWYNKGDNLTCSMDSDISEQKMGWTAISNDKDVNLPVETKLNHLAGNSNVAFRFVTGVLGNNGGGYGEDGFMIDDFEITATDALATFEAVPTEALTNQEIQFSYTSNGADSFLWEFGDGATSTEMNPTHAYTSGGTYTVSLTIMVNGSPLKETKVDYITVVGKKALPYLLADGGDFETNQGDFIANNLSGTGWELGKSEIAGKAGTASGDFAWVTGLNEVVHEDNSRAELVSPTFSFDQPQVYTLEFKTNFSFEDTWDGFIVEYTTDQGDTWIKLNNNQEDGWYNQISHPDAVFGAQVPIFSGDTGGEFQTFSTDLSFLYPNEDVNLRFLFLSDPATVEAGMALDDFQITATEVEAPVSDFTASASGICTGESITFTSNATGTISAYQWLFGENANPGTATGAGPHEVTYTGTGTASVSLRVTNGFGQESNELKADFITISENHTPTFVKENTDDANVSRLVASEGDSYQWFFRNQPIDGATGQSYLASESGRYSVDVTINGCTASSITQNIVTALEEEDRRFEKNVTVYPNPVRDLVKVGISNEVMGKHKISILDATGATLMETEKVKDAFEKIYEISMSSMPNGNYLILIESPKGTAVKQVIKR